MSTMYTFRPIRLPVQEFAPAMGVSRTKQGVRERRLPTNRVLFSPVHHHDLDAFLDQEFQKQTIADTTRWDFDFIKGQPLTESRQYDWRPYTPIYSGVRPPPPPTKGGSLQSSPEDDISDLYPQPIVHHRSKTVSALETEFHVLEEVATTANTTIPTPLKKTPKQSKITDYLPSRKRIEPPNYAKKESGGAAPHKVARLTLSKS